MNQKDSSGGSSGSSTSGGGETCGRQQLRCLHRRLVNTTLRVTGWLTLTGLHVRRPPTWLWLPRLLVLAAFLFVYVGAALLLASSPTEQQVVEGFSVYVFFMQTLIILVVLMTRGGQLDALDEQLETLSKHAACHNATTRRKILTRIGFFVIVAIVNHVIWVVYPIAIGNFKHGNYNFQMKFPDFLETPSSYWYCMLFQIVVVTLSCSLALAFDCCFFAWLNSVEFHLTSVRRDIEKLGSQNVVKKALENQDGSNNNDLMILEPVEKHGKIMFHVESSEKNEEGIKQMPNTIDGIVSRNLNPGDMKVFLGSITSEKMKAPTPPTDAAAALRSIDQHYRLISRLVNSINELCGLPVLLTHAATMSNILFGLFASISLLVQPFVAGQDVHVIGYFTYIFIFFMRITFYSYDGGNIIEKNAAVMSALADMDWLELPEDAKLRRQALVQRASQPLCISALGVFAIKKVNVLNICSFVLTYLVIMIQMLTNVMRPHQADHSAQAAHV